MFYNNSSVVTSARGDTSTRLPERPIAPGILTAKALQDVLQSARQRNTHDETDEVVSPYGRMPRQTRKFRYRNRGNDSEQLHYNVRLKHEIITRRKRCRKLDPMPVMSRSQEPISKPGNQTSSGETGLEVPDEQRIEHLRSGLQQTSAKLQQDADRLNQEIQWIHGHFPVLRLANAKCSRNLRHQLFRNAIQHVTTNFTLRKALLVWYRKFIDAQRKERLQLSACRLIAMFEKISIDRVAGMFNAWRSWVLECQTQERMAAAITLQRLARFLRSRREERESAEKRESMIKAFEVISRSATVIQRAYRRHRRAIQQRQYEAAARKIQYIEMRRAAYHGLIKRQNAAKMLQRTFRTYSKHRNHKRARAIAELFERSREKNARRIQNTWYSYITWRNYDLPVEIVQSLVDQVEFLDAVVSIQRRLRGFQCRFRIQKKNDCAARIQNCWRAGKHRDVCRNQRRMMHWRRDMAASCVQRTFRRMREERKVRRVLGHSTRPLYLRAGDCGDSFRDRFRIPIATRAIVVIQSAWRRHVAYTKEKQLRLTAAPTIQRFLQRSGILSMWKNLVCKARRRDEAARNLQRWVRNIRHCRAKSVRQRKSVVYVLEQISAASTIQRWYRYRRCDSWGIVLARLLSQELPRCIEATNRIIRCWKNFRTRKLEHTHHANIIADLIKQQQRVEVEDRAALLVQRMFQRMIDRRDGKVLLYRYKIFFRQENKRKQQRVIVHKYLEEKSQQRKKKQEEKTGTLKRRASIKSSTGSPQLLSVDSYTTQASAFSLDESTINIEYPAAYTDVISPQIDSPIQYWSEEYQRAYLYDPVTGISTWL